jgi:hypothetical protein
MSTPLGACRGPTPLQVRPLRRFYEDHQMTDEEIHNIWLHMSGKSEGLLEAGGKADFPVLFTNAILEFNKRKWVGLTDEEMAEIWNERGWYVSMFRAVEAKLREKNT